jgi:hypothetical protein
VERREKMDERTRKKEKEEEKRRGWKDPIHPTPWALRVTRLTPKDVGK